MDSYCKKIIGEKSNFIQIRVGGPVEDFISELKKKKITAEDDGRVIIVPYKDDSTYDLIIDATVKSNCLLYEMERTTQSMDSVYQEIVE